MREILKTNPRLEGINGEDDTDHVADPEDRVVSYPFTANLRDTANTAVDSCKTPVTEPTKKGTKANMQFNKNKYGDKDIPPKLKKLLKKFCKIPLKWRKCFLKTRLLHQTFIY